MSHFEIEIKSLLGEKENATALKEKMCSLDPETTCVSENRQLNHYFTGGDIHELYSQVEHLFTGEQHEKFKRITEKGANFSVRTRQKDNDVFLVIKASFDEGTSENTVSRMEFEEPVELPLSALDTLVKSAGYEYQAKWSREREEYNYKGATVCIDRNAGYGYLVEFEKMTEDETAVDQVRKDIEALMGELGVEELPQDRLERMFAHYNKNWPEYYGTDRTFTIE